MKIVFWRKSNIRITTVISVVAIRLNQIYTFLKISVGIFYFLNFYNKICWDFSKNNFLQQFLLVFFIF